MSITIRPFEKEDAGSIRFAYKQAFAGPPWYEKLTDEQIFDRWRDSFQRFGFAALVAVDREIVVGSHWRETSFLAKIATRWGDELRSFTYDFLRRQPECPSSLMTAHQGGLARIACVEALAGGEIIWERHLSVSPAWQKRGIGLLLRRTFIEHLEQEPGNFLVLTRMRSDNAPAIRTAEKVGFQRTGVVAPSRSAPGVNHEFWYRHVHGQLGVVNPREN